MALPVQCHVGFIAEIELPIFLDERAYVLEAPLDTEHGKILYRSDFNPYVLAGKCTHSWVI